MCCRHLHVRMFSIERSACFAVASSNPAGMASQPRSLLAASVSRGLLIVGTYAPIAGLFHHQLVRAVLVPPLFRTRLVIANIPPSTLRRAAVEEGEGVVREADDAIGKCSNQRTSPTPAAPYICCLASAFKFCICRCCRVKRLHRLLSLLLPPEGLAAVAPSSPVTFFLGAFAPDSNLSFLRHHASLI